MAGGSIAKPPEEGMKKARIEIIPLIDVIFFLLATFVLFTLSLNKLSSLDVQLPVAGDSSSNNQQDDTVSIQISEADVCYWNKEQISFSELTPKLQNYKQTTANPRVLICGDNKGRFGATARALDEVRRAGITQVSIETRVRLTGK
jgi:biopolymer transport protein ExbD